MRRRTRARWATHGKSRSFHDLWPIFHLLPIRRLHAQQIARHELTSPGELVAWLGAVQAQDYGAAKWALGLRLADGVTEAVIERALADGVIVRTHALRSTWQLVNAKDVRWMLALVAPPLLKRLASRYRQLELDEGTFRRSNGALEKALRDGGHLTRDELAAVLRGVGISTAGQRLAHLLARAELDALICGGAPRGKQPSWALLERWLRGPHQPLPREDGLAELAGRYFRSRGPATVADFAWWSGLSMAEARAGLESVEPTLSSDGIGGQVYWAADNRVPRRSSNTAHLLPAFDEYLVGYRNRDAVLAPGHVRRLNAGGGMLAPCVVIDGVVSGTWRRVWRRGDAVIELDLFEPSPHAHAAIRKAAARYGAFLGLGARAIEVTEPRRGRSGTPRHPG